MQWRVFQSVVVATQIASLVLFFYGGTCYVLNKLVYTPTSFANNPTDINYVCYDFSFVVDTLGRYRFQFSFFELSSSDFSEACRMI